MSLKLIKIDKSYEVALGQMIEEFKEDQEKNHSDRSPSKIFKNDYHDFDYYLENLENKEAKGDFVPDSVFFCVDEERNRLVGAVNIRHYLNEGLLFDGGHIGDGIRPTERKKGYGTIMMSLALKECMKLGVSKALITCNDDNYGSKKTITNNAGQYENTVVDCDGNNVERYWVNLSEFFGTDDLKGDEIYLKLEEKVVAQPEKFFVPAYKFKICLLDGTIIGECDLRVGHNKNTYVGGNIGYTIYENYRGHRYAFKACKLMFKQAKKHHMTHLYITCNPNNLASNKTIELLNGQYIETASVPTENEMYKLGEREVKVYKIDLHD